VGVSGFFYQQITKDSGSGAVLGSFEGMTTGVGPDLSYAYSNIGNLANDPVFSVGAEVKWLPELSVSNRLEGNIVWLKVVFTCCGNPPLRNLWRPQRLDSYSLRQRPQLRRTWGSCTFSRHCKPSDGLAGRLGVIAIG